MHNFLCCDVYVVTMGEQVEIHGHLLERGRMGNEQVLSLVNRDVDLAPVLHAVSSCARDLFFYVGFHHRQRPNVQGTHETCWLHEFKIPASCCILHVDRIASQLQNHLPLCSRASYPTRIYT